MQKSMDIELEVIGRHALLFDDDATAAFVNSEDALVEWNSIPIDRYDVRHLLSSPPPPRRRSSIIPKKQPPPDSFESDLDYERYLDLDLSHDRPESDDNTKAVDGYNAVAFSYGNNDDSAPDQNNLDSGSGLTQFCPPFAVPENLLIPPTEKLHQIMARTAIFVSKHGGQSEIVLRVKQGDNPTFGFLMPDHQLHSYFRFLVDHPEVLNKDHERKSQDENVADGEPYGGGGALSLLGSLYGAGEDEDGAAETTKENLSTEDGNVGAPVAHAPGKVASPKCTSVKDGSVSNHIVMPKDKAPVVRRNSSINGLKAGSSSSTRKEGESLHSVSAVTDKSRASSMPPMAKVEPLFVEPPSEIKKLVNKIVEFIIKNGKQFEAVLIEQDSEHGRFPFLLSSNQYNPYYLKVLQEAQKSKASGRSSSNEKDASLSLESAACDIPYESDRKEKFKMVIGKSKNDGQDLAPKASQKQLGTGVDAAAAAAILQAATRGIRNPDLGSLSRFSLNGTSREHSNEVGKVSKLVDSSSSLPQSVKTGVPASEADCSEGFSREQKLKAERLKRAKMFVAMLKSGSAPPKPEPCRGLSVEPQGSNVLGAVEDNLAAKEREGSAAPLDIGYSEKIQPSGKRQSADEYNERMSRRKYRSRSSKNAEAEDDVDDDEDEVVPGHSRKKRRSHRSSTDDDSMDEKDEEERVDKHSRRKHRSQRSSHGDELEDDIRDHKSSRKHHRSHRSSNEDKEDEEEHDHRHSRKKRRSSHHGRDGHKHRRRHSSSKDKESRRRHKRNISSDEDQLDCIRSKKHGKGSESEREELEEGEIGSKVSDQSRGSVGGDGGGANREDSVDKSMGGDAIRREASVDISSSYQKPSEPTEVSDELRAKIRAMLRGTL